MKKEITHELLADLSMAFVETLPRESIRERVVCTMRAIAESIHRCDAEWTAVEGPDWVAETEKSGSWALRDSVMLPDFRIDDLNAALFGTGVAVMRGGGRGLGLLTLVSDRPPEEVFQLRPASRRSALACPFRAAGLATALLLCEVEELGLI